MSLLKFEYQKKPSSLTFPSRKLNVFDGVPHTLENGISLNLSSVAAFSLPSKSKKTAV